MPVPGRTCSSFSRKFSSNPDLPLATPANGQVSSINDHGRITRFKYDNLGRTNPTLDVNGKPTSEDGSVTTWLYDSQRGFLIGKRDDADKGADYTQCVRFNSWAIPRHKVMATYPPPIALLKTICF